jgi:hypothetical protein
MNTELQNKKMLAIEFGLLPKGIDEFEFAIVVPNWQAIELEYWTSKERNERDHVIVEIPLEYRNQFVFSIAKQLIESTTVTPNDGIEKIKW